MRRIFVLALALLVCLTGCASTLERDYTVTAAHVENKPPQSDAAYQIGTYPALRSALLSYVEEGMDSGLLRFPTTYAGNLTVDLEKARRQLLEEDPLGSYALSDMTYHVSKIIAYYEAELSFTYRADKTALASIPRCGTRDALSRLLADALAQERADLTVYLTAYPEDDADFFSAALDAAWSALIEEDEAFAQDPPRRPELTAELYPAAGTRRVAVLKLAPPEEEGGASDG